MKFPNESFVILLDIMDLHDAQFWLNELLNEGSIQFQKVPGSAILLRYIKSSYQNDPVRSAVELFLFLFAVRYLLAPTYSTKENRKVKLTDEVRAASTPMLLLGNTLMCVIGNRRVGRRMDPGTTRRSADAIRRSGE